MVKSFYFITILFHALYYFILKIPELFFGLDMGPIVTHKIDWLSVKPGLSILFYVVLCLEQYRSAVMHQSVVVQKTWHGGRNSKESAGCRYFTPAPPSAYFWVLGLFVFLHVCSSFWVNLTVIKIFGMTEKYWQWCCLSQLNASKVFIFTLLVSCPLHSGYVWLLHSYFHTTHLMCPEKIGD